MARWRAVRDFRRPQMRARRWILAALGAVALAATVAGCKPDDEPDWPYGPPPAGAPSGTQAGAADAGAPPAPADVATPIPPELPIPDVVPAPDVRSVEPRDATGDATPLPPLPDDVAVALRRPVSVADLETAEQEVRRGAHLHTQMRLREALVRYRGALDRAPAHVDANYRAARALSALHDTEESLLHLRILHALDKDRARELLAAARHEPDFYPLRGDDRFRALTGFGTVGVAIAVPSNADSKAAERAAGALALLLERAHLPARPVQSPLDGSTLNVPTVLHARAHGALAREVADALGETVSLKPTDTAIGADVVLVWPAGRAVSGLPEAPLEAYLDKRLVAKDEAGMSVLELRSTGSFESEDRARDGSLRRKRRGRFTMEGDRLVLDYEETLERFQEGAEHPEVTTNRGREEVAVSPTDDGTLRVGDRHYEVLRTSR